MIIKTLIETIVAFACIGLYMIAVAVVMIVVRAILLTLKEWIKK